MTPLCNPGCYFLYDHALKRSSIRTIFDIGSNEGGYIGTAPSDMTVHAFEPIPDVFERLKSRYQSRPNTHLNNIGLSDSDYTLTNATVLNTWTIAPKGCFDLDQVPEYTGVTFNVRMQTLDDYCAKTNSSIGVIKLDADGYEPSILRGGEHTILRDLPWIYCELSYLPQRLGMSTTRFIEHILRTLHYIFVSLDGRFTCSDPTAMIDFHFPWNTSFDVMLIPWQHRNEIPKLT